ncbi:hypothetical protein ES703_08057 [subsurface metagenome]
MTLLPGADFPKETGPIAFISQSGGHAVELARQARGWGISFSKVISYGNACDINEADLLEYLAQDSDTKIIAAYIEGPRQGERFRHLVQVVSQTKPVLIWKAGLTQDGARAVNSHTASLSGEETTWDALFKQTGALRVGSLEEIIDTAVALMHLPVSTGRRVAVIGGGGGISVAATDACNQAGLHIPAFNEPLQRELKQILPPAGTAVRNPVDVGAPVVPAGIWHRIWQKVAAAEGVDTIIATQALHLFRGERWRHFFDTKGSSISDSLQIPVDIKTNSGKPVIMVLPVGGTDVDMLEAEKARRQFRDFYLRNGIPVYPSLERAARAIAKVVQYYERRAQA